MDKYIYVSVYYGKQDIWIETAINNGILPKVFLYSRSTELQVFLSR